MPYTLIAKARKTLLARRADLPATAHTFLQYMLDATPYTRGYVHLAPVSFDSEVLFQHDIPFSDAASPPAESVILKHLVAAIPPVQSQCDILCSASPIGKSESTQAYCSATPFWDAKAYPHVLAETMATSQAGDRVDDDACVVHFFHGFGRVWLGDASEPPASDTLESVRVFVNALDDLVYRVYHENMVKYTRTSFLLGARLARYLTAPTRAILQHTQALYQDQPSNEDNIEKIERAAFDIAGVVNDLSDMIALKSGSVTLKCAPFDLRKCIQNAVQVTQDEAQQKQVRLSQTIAAQIPEVIMGDAIRMEQIIVNLLANAIRFTDEGSVQVSAELDQSEDAQRLLAQFHERQQPDDDTNMCASDERLVRLGMREQHCCVVTIAVHDTGRGIPTAQLQRIFYAYRTSDTADDALDTADDHDDVHHGVGIGLTICQKLIEMMGGRMWVRSQLGKGSTFSFSFVTRAFVDLEKARSQWRRVLDNKSLLIVCRDEAIKECMYNAFVFNTDARVIAYTHVDMALAYLSHGSHRIDAAFIDKAFDEASVMKLACKLLKLDTTMPIIGILRKGSEDVMSSPSSYHFKYRVRVPADAYTVVDVTARALSPRELVRRSSQANLINHTALRILVVVHDTTERIALVQTLRTLGYHQHIAAVRDGLTALQKVQRNQYDVALVQATLPLLNGYDTIRKMQSMPNADQTYMIALLHANTSPTSCERLKKIVLHLPFPVDVEELKTMLSIVAEGKSDSD